MTTEPAGARALPAPFSTLLEPVVRFPLVAFALIAFGLQIVLVYVQHHEIEALGVGFFRVYMPAIVAVAVAAAAYGRGPAWKLITSLGSWRVHPKYYAFAVLYPPVVALVSVALMYAVGLKDSLEFDIETLATWGFFKLSITVSIVEEIAWVGFALMVARKWLSLYAACLVAGALWGIWYIPLVMAEIQVAPGLPIAPLIINFMTIAGICGWLYYRTQSALLVAIMQITTNYTSQLIPVLPLRGGVTQYVIFVVLKSLFALGLFLIWGPKPLFGRARDERPAGASSAA